jgi:hypothetical protein
MSAKLQAAVAAAAAAVPALAVGSIIPVQAEWTSYFGDELALNVFWEMPEAGTYTLESTTDNKTWSPAGEFKPRSASRFSIDNVQYTDPQVGYRLTKTA